MNGNKKDMMAFLLEQNEQLTNRYMEAEKTMLRFSNMNIIQKLLNLGMFIKHLKETLKKYDF